MQVEEIGLNVYTGKPLGGGYRGGSPTAVRPSDSALCGSCPLVTPYYCRLGDLLCFVCVYRFVCALLSLHVCLCCFRCLICLL